MTYEELTNVLRQNQNAFSGVVPSAVNAPSIEQIISGISSQYQPIDLGSYGQPSFGGANRYITGSPQFGDVEQIPEYGTLNQLIGPSFVPSAFNKDLYTGINSEKLSDLISTISNDYGGDGAGTSATAVDDAGLATSTNIGTMGVTGIAAALGAMTGLPVGLAANMIGKQAIANAINAQSHAQAVAFNNALVANQLGITNSSQNAAALAAAIDSLSAANPASQAAVSAAQAAQGISGISGGAAANAAANAAAAASAAGHSDAAIGAASQAAANAAVAGLSAAAQAQAASNAAASVDGGTTGPGSAVGIGVGSTTGINAMDAQSDAASAAAAAAAAGVAAADAVGMDGMGVGSVGADAGGVSGIGADGIGFADGGIVLKHRLAGPNPNGPDDGYAALKLGEYVIKQSSVDKYGTEIFDRINQGKISKKAMNSLL